MLMMRRGRFPSNDKAKFEEVLSNLREELDPLLSPVQSLVAQKLHVPTASLKWGASTAETSLFGLGAAAFAEVFVIESGYLIVTATESPDVRRLSVALERTDNSNDPSEGMLSFTLATIADQDAAGLLDAVAGKFETALGSSISTFRYTNDRFKELKAEAVSEDLPQSDEAITVSRALSDPDVRKLAINIKSSRGGLLGKELSKYVSEDDRRKDLMNQLLSEGVVTKEVVVVCSGTQSQIVRVIDRTSLDKLAQEGLRCACGKPINEEIPEDLLILTDLAVILLDKSRWLSVLVREELITLGVPREDILLECVIGADEIDCIALVGGELTIFELKDKEFSVGNAYSFGAKMGLLSAEQSVIVTTEFVSPDVKAHFSRSRASDRRVSSRGADNSDTLHYVEGSDFQSELQGVISKIYGIRGRRLLDVAMRSLTPDSASLVAVIESHSVRGEL
ncbi:hypothetical protein SAMN04487915_101893 [Arthrobacter sp. ov118]|nr:hypothetical protein SAMN04487915_101893 [Arthrobacter sp. ov118]